MLSSALSADNTHSSTLPIWAIPAILSDQFPAPMKKRFFGQKAGNESRKYWAREVV
jgi:hypothetical protein